MTQRYRRKNGPAAWLGTAFDRSILDALLAQEGCAGIRIYNAIEADGTPTVVLVAVDERGHSMPNGVLGELGLPCPYFCDVANDLNSASNDWV